MKRLVAIAIVLAAALTAAGAGAQMPLPASSPVPLSSAALPPPPGYAAFCRRHPGDCGRRHTVVWRLTQRRLAILDRVNIAVNAAVAYRRERVDIWSYPTDGTGDCEDFALEKRRRLIVMGWPSASLRLALAELADGTGHAVLLAATDRGDLVLDNNFPYPVPWQAANYKWVAVLEAGIWRRVSGHRVSGHRVSGHRVSGHRVSGHRVSGRRARP